MEKVQHRSVIRFLLVGGKKREEIKARLDAVYNQLHIGLIKLNVVGYLFLMRIAQDA